MQNIKLVLTSIKFYQLIVVTIVTLAILLPASVAAQDGFVTCTGLDCQFCHLISTGQNVLNWLVLILAVVAGLLFAYAGLTLVTSAGNRAAQEKARNIFNNVIIGYIIVLAGWLLVDTAFKMLVDQSMLAEDAEIGPWNRVACLAQPEATLLTDRLAVEQLSDINYVDEAIRDINNGGQLPAPEGTVSNCGFDESTLVDIPGQPGHQATADTVNRFLNIQSNLASRGITVNVTSSYRPDSRQTELWDQCPRCQREGTVARPCSRGGGGSRHSSGVALDLALPPNSPGNNCDIVRACRSAGASFIMTYARSSHVHCDWGGGGRREVRVNCP